MHEDFKTDEEFNKGRNKINLNVFNHTNDYSLFFPKLKKKFKSNAKENTEINPDSCSNTFFNRSLSKNNQNFTIKIKKNKNVISFEEAKNGKMRPVIDKSQNYGDSTHFNRDSFPKNLSNVNNKENHDCKDNIDCKENKEIQLNIFNYYCYRTKTKKYKYIDLYNRGNFFYRNKMDIIHVFSLLSVLEDFIKKK